ncbi:MAG: hybrid sensor histidine kinase/response regulator [Odoribacter splanchnicus]|nr:hybrid sensor histidine kinase/response regulator [Odoribacter splanchnicus]MBD9179989.1 hybrid sensor histidine kinase/response regulator [Odoribacter splanchnicus]MBD9180202.1 hybrid sensor histidine kinase/response regulator [Odoribacter splanchnicus]
MLIHNNQYTLLVVTSSFEEPGEILETLREAAFQVTTARDFDEIVHAAKLKQPDLLILNVKPSEEQEEYAIIRRMKRHKDTRGISMLFIAAITEQTYIPDCLFYDNVDFISKPFRPKELVIRIQHQLSLMEAKKTICLQNQKLQKTMESRDKLYSVIAHDLRAPIGTIKMIAASLENERNQMTDPHILKSFDMIHETTEEAYNLLENLLRWSRNQNGKTRIYPTTFDLSKAIYHVLALFTAIADSKGISVNNHSKANVTVYADEDMIRTVLRNLLSNAIKFSFPGGQIDVGLSEMPDMVMVSVKDNGQGIKKELQSKLLKGNEYISTYGTHNEKGSGLGLILCRDFVKMNKGKLWFSSQENKGTTFYFTVPRHPMLPATSERR